MVRRLAGWRSSSSSDGHADHPGHGRAVARQRLTTRRRRRAVIAHAVSFWTWWSLCHEGGLTDREAIDVLCAAVFS